MGQGRSRRASEDESEESEDEDGEQEYEEEEEEESEEEEDDRGSHRGGIFSYFAACCSSRAGEAEEPLKSAFVSSEEFKTQTRCKVLLANNVGKALKDYFDVEKMKELGQGGFATVCQGRSKRTGCIRAIKTIPKARSSAEEKRTENEIEAMKRLDHPNIVKLYQTFEDRQCTYLVMEICHGKELFDRIIDEGSFTEPKAATVMRQIFSAVRYMHQAGVCHRDLKPENFLFQTMEPIMQNTLKVIDFGICALFNPPKGEFTTKTGTPMYVAPEVVGNGFWHRYSPACDLWSAGVVLYVLLSGTLPFRGKDDADTIFKVRNSELSFRGRKWTGVSDAAKDFIRGLLTKVPAKRTTADEALQDPWVRGQAQSLSVAPLQINHIENLKAFRLQNKLKKVALGVIARHVDDAEIEQVRKVFMQLDANGDGCLTAAEMRNGFAATGVAHDDIDEILRGVDADGSGEIDYTEFIAATLERKALLQESMVKAAFRVFDKDDDGRISLEELREALQDRSLIPSAGEDALMSLMREADLDGDGHIDFDEFMKMMMKK